MVGGSRRARIALHAQAGTATARRSSKKARHRLAHLRAPRDPLPVHLDRARQRVAAVDRRDHIRRRLRQPVDDQPLDIRLELGEHGVQLNHATPRGEVQLALGRAPRARVQRYDAPGDRRLHEERQPDRNLKARPYVVRKLEVRQPQRPPAHWAVLGIAAAQRPAALAGALDAPLYEVQQVAVLLGDRRVAEVTALLRDVRRGALWGAGFDLPLYGVGQHHRRRGGGSRAGKRAHAGHELGAALGRDGIGDRLAPRGSLDVELTRGPRIAALAAVCAHRANATFTCPCSRSSGTGCSCSRSSSIERPARGRKYVLEHSGQASVPDCSSPPSNDAPQPAQVLA